MSLDAYQPCPCGNQLEAVGEVENAGQASRDVFADAVTQHQFGLDAAGLPQPGGGIADRPLHAHHTRHDAAIAGQGLIGEVHGVGGAIDLRS